MEKKNVINEKKSPLKSYKLVKQEDKEMNLYLKKYPTETDQINSIDWSFIKEIYREEYIKKTKKCFHEMGSSSENKSSSAIVTDFFCKFCEVKYMYEVCSPWHDGVDYYVDESFKQVMKEIEDEVNRNRRLREKITGVKI